MKTALLRACATIVLFVTFVAVSPFARAVTSDYTNNATNSSWNTPGNWSGGIPTSSDTAVFNNPLNTGAQTITLDASQSALGIQLATGEGAVTINSGTGTNTLTLGTGGISANGTGTGRVTFNANVVLSGDQAWNVAALTLANTLTGSGNLTINSTGSPSLTLTPTAAGSVTGTALVSVASGSNIGSVNGNFLNTFSGGVTFSGFYLQLDTNFTATNNITFANSMNIYPNGNNDVFSGSVFGGVGGAGATITYQTAGNVTYSGATDNTGLGLNTAGSTTTILSKTSSSSVHALGGNLGLGTNATVQLGGSGGDQIKDTANVTMGTGSILDLNGRSEAFNTLVQNSGTSTVTNTSASTTSTLTVGNGTSTYSGVIQNGASGTGVVALTKTGSGTLTLSGVNTYTGATSINTGTLAVSGTIGSGAGTAITVASGATLTATGSIAGASSLTTSGTTTLSGTNTYTGATAINGGTTTVTRASSLGSNSTVTLAGGATLAFTNPGSTVTLPTGNSTWQSSSDWRGTPSNLGNGISYQVGANGGSTAQPDFILVDLGANYSLSQLTMTIANSFQTMQFLTANSSVGAFSSLFTLNGHSNVSPSVLNTGLFTADSATFGTGTSDYALGTQSFTLSGVSGQYFAFYITKRVNNGYGLDLSNLVLSQLGNATTQSIGSLASSDATTKVTLDGNVSLNVGTDNTSTAFAGVISGAGILQKSGTGTQTLSGNNTYSGGTTVSVGTLLVNNTSGSGTGTGSVSVAGGAILGGTGTIAPGTGNSISVSGEIAPGTAGSIGELTFNGGSTGSTLATFASGATFAFDLTTTGQQSDKIALINGAAGDFQFNGNSIVFTVNGTLASGQAYTIFTADVAGAYGGLSFTGNKVTDGLNFSGLGGAFDSSSYIEKSGFNLVLQVVPEPTTWALLAFSLTTVTVFRRRRNS